MGARSTETYNMQTIRIGTVNMEVVRVRVSSTGVASMEMTNMGAARLAPLIATLQTQDMVTVDMM